MRVCTRAVRTLQRGLPAMSGRGAETSKMTYERQQLRRLSSDSSSSDRKGKGRARDVRVAMGVESGDAQTPLPTAPLTSMLEEALNTPITHGVHPSSIDSTHTPSPIPHGILSSPPLAHHPATFPRPQRPQLVSQLTRLTLPVSSLSYATAASDESNDLYSSPQSLRHPSLSYQPELVAPVSPRRRKASSSSHASSSTAWQSFPDLDPTTGLPLSTSMQRSTSTGDMQPGSSLHLQRTITSLLASPSNEARPKAASSYLPSLPSMPALASLSLGIPGRSTSDSGRPRTHRRQLSSSAPSEKDSTNWGSSLGNWWNGSGGGTKGSVQGMMSDEDVEATAEETQAKIKDKYRTPKNPVVFCHGLLGFDYLGPTSLPPLQISHWRGIREVLESNGVEVLITRVPATASIEDRAKILEEVISEKYPGRDVNLIGHSMGGLDCRYLTSQINPTQFNIVSVTTVATPHRGSPFADYVIDSVIGRERLPSLLSMMGSFKLQNSGDGSAFDALSTRSMKAFNALVLDRPDVKYMSWGAAFEPGLLDTFKWPHSIILAKEGPNDGLVSVQSAQWGEYRGTLLGVNHLDLVGWVNHVRYAFSNWSGNPISFKPATFYLEVSDYLAGQGF